MTPLAPKAPQNFFEIENFNKYVIFDTPIQSFTLRGPGPGRFFTGPGSGISTRTGIGTGIEIPVDPGIGRY